MQLRALSTSVIIAALIATPVATGHSSDQQGQAARAVPVLGAAWSPGATGFGHAHPRRFDSGGDGLGGAQKVRWTHWGSSRAIGHGWAIYVAPDEAAYQGHLTRATIVASQSGRCHGRYAYRDVHWYFPGHGGSLSHPTNGFGASDMCSG
jgi:hypothetical protein